MDVSIIIVTRNTSELLGRALNSIRESNDGLRKEVLVVDNGSDRETPELVRTRYPEIVYLPQRQNLGFARANNQGARQARGAFLLLLNSDARLKPDSLGESVQHLREHPQCGVVGVQLLNTDGSRQNSIANDPSLATELLNKSMLRLFFPRRFPGKSRVYEAPQQVESVIGAFLLTRRDVWERLGGLNEGYFFFLEETDYCRRVRRVGLSVDHLPGVEVWHDQGQTVRQVKVPARVEYWRSRYFYFRQHHSPSYQWIVRTGLVVRLLVGFLGNAVLAVASPRFRDKCRLQGALLRWHWAGCPSTPSLAESPSISSR